MGGRRWTAEEDALLEEWAGKYNVAQMAKKLGRSAAAVNIRVCRLGLGGIRRNTEHLSERMLCLTLGIDTRTFRKKWIKKGGLKGMRKGSLRLFKQEDVIRFMRDHPDYWNARKITDDSMFLRYPWYQKKKKTDVRRQYYWTPQEVARLRVFRKRGMTIPAIAERMHRTPSSVRQKLFAERIRKDDVTGINRAV